MSEYVVRNFFSDSFGEINQPLLSCSCLQSSVIFPISISTVKVIVKNELSKFVPASCGIHACCSWELSSSKCTDDNFDVVSMIFFHDIHLDLLSITSKSCDSIISKIFP